MGLFYSEQMDHDVFGAGGKQSHMSNTYHFSDGGNVRIHQKETANVDTVICS